MYRTQASQISQQHGKHTNPKILQTELDIQVPTLNHCKFVTLNTNKLQSRTKMALNEDGSQ